MTDHDITVREKTIDIKPSGTRRFEIAMKVDDSYVLAKGDLDNIHRTFANPWDNPAVKPTDDQLAAAIAKGKRVAEEMR